MAQSRNHRVKFLLEPAGNRDIRYFSQRRLLPRIAHTLDVLPHEFYFIGCRAYHSRCWHFPPAMYESDAALRRLGDGPHECLVTLQITCPTAVKCFAAGIVRFEHESRKERQAVVVRDSANY